MQQIKQLFSHFDARDAHAYLGLLLVSIGLGAVYWPLALVVSGSILLYMALRRV